MRQRFSCRYLLPRLRRNSSGKGPLDSGERRRDRDHPNRSPLCRADAKLWTSLAHVTVLDGASPLSPACSAAPRRWPPCQRPRALSWRRQRRHPAVERQDADDPSERQRMMCGRAKLRLPRDSARALVDPAHVRFQLDQGPEVPFRIEANEELLRGGDPPIGHQAGASAERVFGGVTLLSWHGGPAYVGHGEQVARHALQRIVEPELALCMKRESAASLQGVEAWTAWASASASLR